MVFNAGQPAKYQGGMVLVNNFQKRVKIKLAAALPSVYPDQICKQAVADLLDCQISQMGLATLQLPHGHCIGEL